MVSAIRSSVVLAVALVMSPSIVLGQRPSSNEDAPTPMEQALVEHACRVPGQARSASDAYDACLAAGLTALRTDFGRDLARVAAKDRRRIDATCADLRTMRGRDAYVACLSGELQAIRNNSTKGSPAAVSGGAGADS